MEILTNWFIASRENASIVLLLIGAGFFIAFMFFWIYGTDLEKPTTDKAKISLSYYSFKISRIVTVTLFALTMVLLCIDARYCTVTTYYQEIESVETYINESEGVQYRVTASDGTVYLLNKEDVRISSNGAAQPYGEFVLYNIQPEDSIDAREVILHIDQDTIQASNSETL